MSMGSSFPWFDRVYDRLTSPFHFNLADRLNQIGHVIESLHVPDVYHYQHKLNTESHMKPSDYKLAYHSIQKETFWMTFVQMVSNLFLLAPLLVAGGLMKLLLTNFSSSFQSERETLCSCGQHRNLPRGGESL